MKNLSFLQSAVRNCHHCFHFTYRFSQKYVLVDLRVWCTLFHSFSAVALFLNNYYSFELQHLQFIKMYLFIEYPLDWRMCKLLWLIYIPVRHDFFPVIASSKLWHYWYIFYTKYFSLHFLCIYQSSMSWMNRWSRKKWWIGWASNITRPVIQTLFSSVWREDKGKQPEIAA